MKHIGVMQQKNRFQSIEVELVIIILIIIKALNISKTTGFMNYLEKKSVLHWSEYY